MANDPGTTGGDSRYNLLSLYLPALILALGVGIALPALPVLAKSFDISFGLASWVIISYALGGTISTLPMGYLSDKIGRRRVLLAGPFLTAGAAFLTASAGNFPELLVYRFIEGWGAQMWSLGRYAIIADTGAARQRGKQMTGMSTVDTVGKLLGPAIGGLVAVIWDVRAPFVIYGLLALIAIIPSFKLIKESAPTRTNSAAPEGSAAPTPARSSLTLLLVFPIIMLFGARIFESLARGALFGGTVNLYTVYAYDVGAGVIGLLGTMTGIVTIPITLTAGFLMDRFGRKATLIPGFSLLALTHALMAAVALLHLNFPVYVVVYLTVFASQALTGGNMLTLGSDLAPAQARGLFFGVYNLISQTGNTLSPVMFAALATIYDYPASFVFLSLMSLGAALVLGLLVPDPVGRAARQKVTAQTVNP